MIRDGKFRKANGSETQNCVEVAALPQGGVRVRDSKDKAGPVLAFTDTEWRAFIASAHKGQLSLPS